MKASYTLKRPILDTRLVEVTLTMTAQNVHQVADCIDRAGSGELLTVDQTGHLDLIGNVFRGVSRSILDQYDEDQATPVEVEPECRKRRPPEKIAQEAMAQQRPVRGGMLLEDTPAPKGDERSVVGNADDLATYVPDPSETEAKPQPVDMRGQFHGLGRKEGG